MLKGLRASRDDLDLILGHESASDRDRVGDLREGNWHRPFAEALARLTYGVVVFGENVADLEQMQRDEFVLCRGLVAQILLVALYEQSTDPGRKPEDALPDTELACVRSRADRAR